MVNCILFISSRKQEVVNFLGELGFQQSDDCHKKAFDLQYGCCILVTTCLVHLWKEGTGCSFFLLDRRNSSLVLTICHRRGIVVWLHPGFFLMEKISFSDHVLGFLFLQAQMRAAAKARQRSDAELGMEDFL